MRASTFALTALGLGLALASCAPAESSYAVSENELMVCHSVVVEGVDVASFQGAIDWPAVHASGREFAIARIGDGTYSDPNFVTNYQGIHDAGMIRGAYLFWRPHLSAATEASIIIDAVGTLGPGDLPPTIDVECMCPFHSGGGCGVGSYSDCIDVATASARLADVVSMVEAAIGRPPMIYTGTWFWDGGTYLAGGSSFPSSPLWVSGYTSGCVSVPSGWTDWQIWQYSDGSCSGCVSDPVPGIGSNVDRDRWNGDLASLMAFTGGGTPIYRWQYVDQSFPLASVGTVQIRQGETASAWIELRNTGTAPWDENTFLGTSAARDRASMFVGPDWTNDHRLAHVPAGTTIAPGETYRFTWTWSVPASTPIGMYDEHYGLVEEGVTWFGDSGGPADDVIEGIVEVLPGVDSGVMPMPDAAIGGDAGGGPTDAGMPMGDGAMPNTDSGALMARPLAGGCGCRTGARGGPNGWLVIAMLGATFALRRQRRR